MLNDCESVIVSQDSVSTGRLVLINIGSARLLRIRLMLALEPSKMIQACEVFKKFQNFSDGGDKNACQCTIIADTVS